MPYVPLGFLFINGEGFRDLSSPALLWPCVEWTGAGVRGSELFLWWLKPNLRAQHSQQALQLAGRETASDAGLCGHSWATGAVSIFCRATADLPYTPLFSPRTIKKTCQPSHCTLSSPLPVLFPRRLGLLMVETFAGCTERQFSLDFRHSGDTALLWKLGIRFPKATLSALSPKNGKAVYKFNNLYLLK